MHPELRPVHIALWVGGVWAFVLTIVLNALDPVESQVLEARQLALTAFCVLPVVLAAGALAHRPILLVSAGLLSFVVAPSAGALGPLFWVTAVLYLRAYRRLRDSASRPLAPKPLAVLVPVALAAAGYVWLSTDLSQVCAEDAGRGVCASVPPESHIAVAVACAAAAALSGWVLARPRPVAQRELLGATRR